MKFPETFTFTLLFILVGFSYLYLKPSSAPKPSGLAELPTPTMELLPEEDRAIRFIQIQNLNKNEIIAIERTRQTEGARLPDGQGQARAGWMLRYPVRYPADSMIVEGLVAALKYSKKARKFPAERGWQEYGLDRPSLKVGIETEGSSKRRYLYFGDPSPVGNFVFARWEGEKEYFLIQNQLKSIFNVSLYSLRMKRIFTLPLKGISKISVRTGEEEFVVEKREKDWSWTTPAFLSSAKLSEKRSKKILSSLGSLHVKEFLEGEPIDAKGIFSPSSPSLEIAAENGGQERLILGQEIPEREAYYATQQNEGGAVFLVSKDRIQNFFSLIQKSAQKAIPPAGN